MDLGSGVSRRGGAKSNKSTKTSANKSQKSKKVSRKGSRKSNKLSRASRKLRPSRRRKSKISLPKTVKVRSRKSLDRIRASRANTSMSLTELQFLAKSRGIPFGGLSRTKLIKKINNYYY